MFNKVEDMCLDYDGRKEFSSALAADKSAER